MTPNESIAELLKHQRQLESALNWNAEAMASLLVPHIRRANHDDLKKLKKALAKYNTHTMTWKD